MASGAVVHASSANADNDGDGEDEDEDETAQAPPSVSPSGFPPVEAEDLAQGASAISWPSKSSEKAP